MTWDAFHRRGEVLRAVIDEADKRRDGVLPMDIPGVAETFGDELTLVGALQLRWHTKLAGMIERGLMEQPGDLEAAVLSAWRRTATELAGIRAILDACTEAPTSEAMARVLDKAHRKDWALMAAMAGRSSTPDAHGVNAGRDIEARARAAYRPTVAAPSMALPRGRHRSGPGRESLLERIRAHLAA